MEGLLDRLTELFGDNLWARNAAITGTVALLCLVAYYVARRIVLRIVKFFVARTKTTWDDIVLERGVFNRLALLAPGLVVYYAGYLFQATAEDIVQRVVVAYMQLVFVAVLTSGLTALNDIYVSTGRAKDVPIKGYIQIAKLIIILVGGIIIFATVINRSPWALLSGIGAATAILLLVFKDTILSFVASIQIASTGMVKVGDWISMPQYGADGDVIDISLHRITVQNWDKTIVQLPTHRFLDEAFTNWRGMMESGGRRIMRDVSIDMTSVHFLSAEEVKKLSKIQILKDYIERKKAELDDYNQKHGIDEAATVNGRRMTNLGTFRAYLVEYLKRHPQIHQEMTFLVRQLQPSPTGIPMQVYVFSRDIRWAHYEGIQADIFDHILAALPEFGLRVFQNPTGADFRELAS